MDGLAQQLGIGGCLTVAILYLFLKFKPWQPTNGSKNHHPTAGMLEPAEWEMRIARIVKDVTDARNDRVKELVRECNEPLMDMLREIIDNQNDMIRMIERQSGSK